MGLMGKRQRIRIAGAQKEATREADLLGLRADLAVAPDRLRKAVRLLLVCRSSLERQIVSSLILRNLSIAETAARLDIAAGRVSDIRQSLMSCAASAELAAKRCEALARWSKRSRSAPRERITCLCGFRNQIEPGDPLICARCAQALEKVTQ